MEANIFIPWVELVQSIRRGDNGSMLRKYRFTLIAELSLTREIERVFYMNDKVLIIFIFSLLGIGFVSVLFIAIPWFMNYALPNWRDALLDSGIVMIAVGLFVYGFYMNTKMHK